MPESALQLGQFQDPYNFQSGPINYEPFSGFHHTDKDYGDIYIHSGNGLGAKIGDFLGITDYKGQYDRYLQNKEREYERANIQSARAWEEYLDSTKYQRAVADLKAAGLNPWLAVQHGLSGSAQAASTSTGGSSGKRASQGNQKDNTAASLIGAAAKIIAALILA